MTVTRRIALGGAIALATAAPAVLGDNALRTATTIAYMGLFAVSFNLLFAQAGLLSLGHNAALGVGGYAFALLALGTTGLHPLLALLGALAAGTLIGALVGTVCARMRGSQLALMTLALSQLLHALAVKWRSVTHGDDGMIVPLSRPLFAALPGLVLDDARVAYAITLVVLVAALALTWRLLHTPLGQGFRLLRDNEERAAFLGYHVGGLRVALFSYAGALAGLAGGLLVMCQGLISPEALGLQLGGEVIFMALLGGAQSFLGPLVGAGLFTLLEDLLSAWTPHWLLLIGLLFVAAVLFAPQGLAGLVELLRGFRAGAVDRSRTPASGAQEA